MSIVISLLLVRLHADSMHDVMSCRPRMHVGGVCVVHRWLLHVGHLLPPQAERLWKLCGAQELARLLPQGPGARTRALLDPPQRESLIRKYKPWTLKPYFFIADFMRVCLARTGYN